MKFIIFYEQPSEADYLCTPDGWLCLGKEAVTVCHTPDDDYFKIGLWCREGKAVYEVSGQRFTKYFGAGQATLYPDNHVNFEVYICRHMMEIETLVPLESVLPEKWTEHEELWEIGAMQGN